jgi:hypothetical protein
MHAWIVWLAAAAVLGVVEMVTLAFAAGLMAAAALVAAVVAGVGGGVVLQSLAFAALPCCIRWLRVDGSGRRRIAAGCGADRPAGGCARAGRRLLGDRADRWRGVVGSGL